MERGVKQRAHDEENSWSEKDTKFFIKILCLFCIIFSNSCVDKQRILTYTVKGWTQYIDAGTLRKLHLVDFSERQGITA